MRGGLLSGISFIVTKPLGKVNELIEKIHNRKPEIEFLFW